MRIAFLVKGLFEISDSIGFDCVYQYREAASGFAEIKDVSIFADRYERSHYPDVPIQGMDAFHAWCAENPYGLIVYHYCGAWPEIDTLLKQRVAPSIVRWHNNTSPWFYFEETNNLLHTAAGFKSIVELAERPNLYFWINSSFTRDQLVALGGSTRRCAVVYPASRYLGKSSFAEGIRRPYGFAQSGPINLLFVGRVVAHKGHRTIIAVAQRLQEVAQRPVIVRFAGREDRIKQSIAQFAVEMGVETHFYGEVSEASLAELYGISDALLCLSEHEGFGLPVFEAMRCSVPVVAWATTAFRELLADHPFAFRYYDLNMFASAIASLLDPEIHKQVLRIQRRVLSLYTGDVVRQQISDGIFKLISRNASSAEALFESKPEAGRALCNTMNVWLNRAHALPQEPKRRVRHDSGSNLVSLYDIKLFRALFDGMKQLRFAPFAHSKDKGTLHLAAEGFSSHRGALVGGDLIFVSKNYPAGHLIFGPYLALPAGDFTATFDLDFIFPSGRAPVPVLVDVCCGPVGVIAKAMVPAHKVHEKDIFAVDFSLPEDSVVTEFRVDVQQDFEAEVIFRGINVRRQKMPMQGKQKGGRSWHRWSG